MYYFWFLLSSPDYTCPIPSPSGAASLNVASLMSKHEGPYQVGRFTPSDSLPRILDGSQIFSSPESVAVTLVGLQPSLLPIVGLDNASPRPLLDPFAPAGPGCPLNFPPSQVDATFIVGSTQLVLLSSPCPNSPISQSFSIMSPSWSSLHILNDAQSLLSSTCHISFIPSLPLSLDSPSSDSSLSPRSKANWFAAVLSKEPEFTSHLLPVSPKRVRDSVMNSLGWVHPSVLGTSQIDDLPLASWVPPLLHLSSSPQRINSAFRS